MVTVTLKGVICCDFCGKNQHERAALIQGPNDIAICDECSRICVSIVEAAAITPATPTPVEQGA